MQQDKKGSKHAPRSKAKADCRLYSQGVQIHHIVNAWKFIPFVTEFPLTVSGKVQKFVIGEIEIRDRGLEKIAQVRTA